MLSMTGFGLSGAQLGEGRLSIELRALNHRHQDVRVRLPQVIAEHAFYVEQLARERLGRGRYDISVRAEGTIGGHAELSVDRAENVLRALLDLRSRVAPDAGLSVDAVLSLPDVVRTEGPDAELTRQALSEALNGAITRLTLMRKNEGDTLQRDLTHRVTLLRDLASQLAAGAASLLLHQRQRLEQRVNELLTGLSKQLDPSRIEQEIALLADKSDITEELVRFASHLDQFDALLSSEEEPVGRRMDFLLQELGREINTIGSKSQHAPLAHLVVTAKAEVERLREQVQNVE